MLKEYHAVIQEQVNAGVVERVEEDGPGEVGEVHYLAHHPVVCQDKQTTKVRLVYDASAKKSGGPSLNDCLYFWSITVARITSKIYDPMGFITPVTVKMKLLCQSLCKKKMG